MLMFLFRCLWPLGSMTCPTQSCWTSSRSLRGWAKSITSTQSSSNKGPQANFVWLFHLSSEQTGVQKSKKKNLIPPETPHQPGSSYHCPPEHRLLHSRQSHQSNRPTHQTKITMGEPLVTFWRHRHCHLLVRQQTVCKLPSKNQLMWVNGPEDEWMFNGLSAAPLDFQ